MRTRAAGGDDAFPAGRLRTTRHACRNATGRLPAKTSLNHALDTFQETGSPRIAGQINDMQIKLTKFEGAFAGHFYEHENELFLVHRGRLLMQFRDRKEVIEQGEFIVVPHGVEHCPAALTDTC